MVAGTTPSNPLTTVRDMTTMTTTMPTATTPTTTTTPPMATTATTPVMTTITRTTTTTWTTGTTTMIMTMTMTMATAMITDMQGINRDVATEAGDPRPSACQSGTTCLGGQAARRLRSFHCRHCHPSRRRCCR
mmetsp:Transcript_84178/g.176145  ORF Transcript_84178/g.176145 Transcript_84178/m.176145 type:complete len:133 (-) Transcript_84178:880-1278(-)